MTNLQMAKELTRKAIKEARQELQVLIAGRVPLAYQTARDIMEVTPTLFTQKECQEVCAQISFIWNLELKLNDIIQEDNRLFLMQGPGRKQTSPRRGL